MREEGDGRGHNDGWRRYKDKEGRSGYIIFGMREGTAGFRKKNLIKSYICPFSKNNNNK